MKIRTAAVVAVLATAACTRYVSGTPLSATTVAPTNTHAATQASPTSTSPPAVAPGPHSKMLPEITLPAGTTEAAHNTPGDETWFATTPFDQTVAMLKAQLPIGQTFRGVPWCKGDGPVSPDINEWEWSTDTEALTVFAQRPGLIGPQQDIEFRWEAVTDGSGREGCTAPLPASVSAEPPPGPAPTNPPSGSGPLPHSDEAEIDMPPGSWLSPSNPETVKTHSEMWNYDVSQSDMVAWLQQRLPVGQPFHGIAWCSAPQIEGQTAWEWISNGQRFYVQVTNYNLVEFQRGPTDWPCTR
jgi:hypothetical protein